MRQSLLLLAATAIAWGCGEDATGPSSSDAGGGGGNPDAALSPSEAGAGGNALDGAPSPSDGAPAPTSYCADKPALAGVTDVSGVWVIRAQATQIIEVPGFTPVGKPLKPQTIFYVLTTLAQSGTDIFATGRYCDRDEIDEPGLATVVVPDKWAHTEKPVVRTGRLAAGNDGIPVLTFPTLVEFVGMVPDLTASPLPTSPNDPRVIDEDNDGHPGITINITGLLQGSLYAAQRQTTSIAAIAVAPDRFEGKLDFISEQKVLDSTPAQIMNYYKDAVASTDPTPCSSTFAMVKVADLPNSSALDASAGAASPDGGGTLGCEWVRANETKLFPQ